MGLKIMHYDVLQSLRKTIILLEKEKYSARKKKPLER
jgi:hypothetical protein